MKNLILLFCVLGALTFSCKKSLNPSVEGDQAQAGAPNLKVDGIVASNDSAFVVKPYAGSGTAGSSNGTSALTAQFDAPEGVVFDSGGNMFIADCHNHVIRKITTAGVVSVFAGAVGVSGAANGSATVARFFSPIRLSIDAANNLYVADRDNARIRKVTSAGVVSTIAGTSAGTGTTQFDWPIDVAVSSDGTKLYVADSHNNRIQKIILSGGTYTTSLLAGQVTAGYTNGTGSAAKFSSPSGVAIDNSGNIMVADRNNNCVRRVTSAGAASLWAGVPGTSYDVDAPRLNATFGQPYGITVANDGCIYVTDIAYHNIRRISNTSPSFVATVAGTSTAGYTNGTFTTLFNTPTAIAIDNSGKFYIADANNNRIRQLVPETRVIQYAQGWIPIDTTTYPGVKRYRYRGNRFWLPSIGTNVSQNVNIIDIDMSLNHFDFKQVSDANRTILSNIIGHPTDVVAALSGTFATNNHAGKYNAYLRNNDVTYWLTDQAIYPDNYWHYHDGMFFITSAGVPGIEQSDMTQNPFSPPLRKYMMSGGPLLIKNSVPIEITSPLSWGPNPADPPNTLRPIIAPRSVVAIPVVNNHVLLICIDGIEGSIDCYATASPVVPAPGRYGMTTKDATQFIQQYLHTPWALNLDGGGSSSMYMMGATVAQDGDNGGVSGGIPVINYPDWDSSCSGIPNLPHDQYNQQRNVMQDVICVIQN